jgi:hypothetical protein
MDVSFLTPRHSSQSDFQDISHRKAVLIALNPYRQLKAQQFAQWNQSCCEFMSVNKKVLNHKGPITFCE